MDADNMFIPFANESSVVALFRPLPFIDSTPFPLNTHLGPMLYKLFFALKCRVKCDLRLLMTYALLFAIQV